MKFSKTKIEGEMAQWVKALTTEVQFLQASKEPDQVACEHLCEPGDEDQQEVQGRSAWNTQHDRQKQETASARWKASINPTRSAHMHAHTPLSPPTYTLQRDGRREEGREGGTSQSNHQKPLKLFTPWKLKMESMETRLRGNTFD